MASAGRTGRDRGSRSHNGTPLGSGNSDSGCREAAMAYAQRGWPVIPLHTPADGRCSCGKADCGHPGKHPRTPRGLHNATTDPNVITRWWERWPNANVGIVCGDGLAVLDVDPRHGGDQSLSELEATHEPIRSLAAATGGGGRHFYLLGPVDLRSRVGFRPGLDLKAEGGYIVAPPSLHASGRRYEWTTEGSEPKEMPTWLIDLLQGGRIGRSVSDLVRGQIPKGQRNSTLASLAGSMRRNGLPEDAIGTALTQLNTTLCESPLPQNEVDGIATSIGRYAPAAPPQKAPVARPAGPILDARDPLGIARSLVRDQFMGEGRRLIHSWGGALLRWDGTHYRILSEEEIRVTLYEYLERALKSTADGLQPFRPRQRSVTEVLDALRAATHLPADTACPSWLDGRSDPSTGDLLACANGVLHVPTRQLMGHDPSLFIRNALPFDYVPHGPPPEEWLRFLRSAWPDDDESIRTLQEILGYLVSGQTAHQKAFIILGPKRSGKGTISRVTRELLGKENVAGPTLSSLTQPFGLEPLIDQSLAVISDARLSGRTDQAVVVERLLAISGEDLLTVDRKYQKAWTGGLKTRVLMLTNELPRLMDGSGALASRFVVLTMTESFYGKEDVELFNRLMPELPAILRWALDGWDRLRARGHFLQPASSEAAIRDLEDLGSPMGAFVRECCVAEPEAETPIARLYEHWVRWCKAQGYRHVSPVQQFGGDLRAVVPGIKVGDRRRKEKRWRVYKGIRLTHGTGR